MRALNKRLLLAWLLSIPFSYFVLGVLSNFYQTSIEIGLLNILIHAGLTLFVYFVLGKTRTHFQSRPVEVVMAGVLIIALLVFVPAMYYMAKQYPNIFHYSTYHLESGQLVAFLVALIPAFPLSVWLLSIARARNFAETRFYKFVDANLPGLLISVLFFSAAMIFLPVFNQPAYDADDIFFDADGNLWRWRFGTPAYRDYYWRPAHPFVLIIIRPLVALISVFLKGDTAFATFVLVALTGALCVFLVWDFVKTAIGSSMYALLIAFLFGASTTQLAFSVIIETYIFLAAVALIFLVLLLKGKPLYALIITGLVAFGITISNFAQTVIAHFFVKRNLKQLIIYGLIVAALVVPLSLLNNLVYPESQPYFWELSTLEAEGHNSFPANIQRANLFARVMFLHSIVSPEPLVINDGWPFVKTWMFWAAIKKTPMRVATYETPFNNAMAFTWLGMMLLGGALFLRNLFKQDNRFFFTFIVTLLFYFALHLQYGKDVFLYSANWAYAIVLFHALAWRELADKRWFQVFLMVFVVLLLVNNSHMLWVMLNTSAPSVR